MDKFVLTVIIICTFVTTLIISDHSCYAHMIDSKKIQEWNNTKNNLKIQFAYNPEKPVIDTFTNLEFSLTDSRTREHIKDAIAHVTVTNGQRLFKFENISIQNGHFLVDYIFPDDGTHQVLLRIDRTDYIDLASFQVFVPHQLPPSLLSDVDNLVISLAIISAVGVITLVILKRK